MLWYLPSLFTTSHAAICVMAPIFFGGRRLDEEEEEEEEEATLNSFSSKCQTVMEATKNRFHFLLHLLILRFSYFDKLYRYLKWILFYNSHFLDIPYLMSRHHCLLLIALKTPQRYKSIWPHNWPSTCNFHMINILFPYKQSLSLFCSNLQCFLNEFVLRQWKCLTCHNAFYLPQSLFLLFSPIFSLYLLFCGKSLFCQKGIFP